MACNSYNHSDCNCGWGGKNYSSGNITMENAYNQIVKFENEEKNIKNIHCEFTEEEYKSFTIPNVKCSCCEKKIYFYKSPYGGKVFFEELGPPWKKHCCEPKCCEATKKNIPQKISQNNFVTDKSIPTYEQNNWTLCLFIREESTDKQVKKIIIKSIKDNIEYSFFIQKKCFESELRYRLPIYFRKLNDNFFEISFYFDEKAKEKKIIVGKYPSNYDLENFINRYIKLNGLT